MWRGIAVMFICATVVGVFGISLAMASEDGISPESAYQVQEHDHLKATDQSVTQVAKDMDEIQKDRVKKHDESADWKLRFEELSRESRERLGRDEGIAIGAFSSSERCRAWD